ncbi:MAG: hypothetical protein Q9212_002730 [Teloschistes hypoglaucus]
MAIYATAFTRPNGTMAGTTATSSVEELIFLIDKLSISSGSKSKIKRKQISRGCPKPPAIVRDSLGETSFKPKKLVSTRQKPTANIHDLPTEIVELVLQYLDVEDDLQTLKNLRQVCKGLCELATPLVFKAISIRRCPSAWRKLNALCLALPLAKYVKKLEIGSPWIELLRFPPIPASLEALKIDHLKFHWYKCFLTWALYVPVATSFLTKLHIDTRHECLDKKSIVTDYGLEAPYLDGHYGFANLKSLIISQNPVFVSLKDDTVGILYLWSRPCFPQLQSLELHFLSTSPDHLVDLLEACNHISLCHVRIYRPIWKPEELRHPRMQGYISALKKDDKVVVEDSEPWTEFGQYSEEEFSFMIANHILPSEWNHIPEDGWASDVLNQYFEYLRVVLKEHEDTLVVPWRRPKGYYQRRVVPPTWIPRKGLDYTFIDDP